jgi:predicted RNA-binding Zn-ribbon protein involved in translation (DUF1610 family)
MKSIQISSGEQRQTWAGCVVLLLTCLVAFPFTIWLTIRVTPYLPAGRFDELPRFVRLLVGILVYSPTVLFGLAFYYATGKLFKVLGLPLVEDVPGETEASEYFPVTCACGKRFYFGPDEVGQPFHCPACGHDQVVRHTFTRRFGEAFLITQTADRLTIRETATERVIGLIMCLLMGPGFSLGLLWLVYLEFREPWGFARDILVRRGIFGFRVDPEGPMFKVLGAGVTGGTWLVCGGVSVIAWVMLYRWLKDGGVRGYLDRARRVVIERRRLPIPFAAVRHVALKRDCYRIKGVAHHQVSLVVDTAHPDLPAPMAPDAAQALAFLFSDSKVAEALARVLAQFLEVGQTSD